jgi:hypothetical protein
MAQTRSISGIFTGLQILRAEIPWRISSYTWYSGNRFSRSPNSTLYLFWIARFSEETSVHWGNDGLHSRSRIFSAPKRPPEKHVRVMSQDRLRSTFRRRTIITKRIDFHCFSMNNCGGFDRQTIRGPLTSQDYWSNVIAQPIDSSILCVRFSPAFPCRHKQIEKQIHI